MFQPNGGSLSPYPASYSEYNLNIVLFSHVSKTCSRFEWICFYDFSVFRNGDLLCPPFRFILPRNMQQDLEQILSLVTEKVSLRTGAVRRSARIKTKKRERKKKEWFGNSRPTFVLYQVVLFGRSACVLSWGTGDWPLLRCCGDREIQETSICGAVCLKSYRKVL